MFNFRENSNEKITLCVYFSMQSGNGIEGTTNESEECEMVNILNKEYVYAGGFVAYLAGLTKRYTDIDIYFPLEEATPINAVRYANFFGTVERIRKNNVNYDYINIYNVPKSTDSRTFVRDYVLLNFDQTICSLALFFDKRDGWVMLYDNRPKQLNYIQLNRYIKYKNRVNVEFSDKKKNFVETCIQLSKKHISTEDHGVPAINQIQQGIQQLDIFTENYTIDDDIPNPEMIKKYSNILFEIVDTNL